MVNNKGYELLPSGEYDEPEPWMLEEIEQRKKALHDRKIQEAIAGDISGDDYNPGIAGYVTGKYKLVYSLPLTWSIKESKLAAEDREEDHWNSSYTREHNEHLLCHYPGYRY